MKVGSTISICSRRSISTSCRILSNGSVICDLYEDEDIPLTLSVDNFKNVAEKVQSYSKGVFITCNKKK